jgi:hypothetical protein
VLTARRLKRWRRELLESSVALTIAEDASAPAGVRTIELGLVVTPVIDVPTVERLGEDLERELARRYPAVRWKITAVRDTLVTAPAALPRCSTRLAHSCSIATGISSCTSPSFRCGSRAGRS